MYSITLSIVTVLSLTLVHAKELSELETLSTKPTRCTYERAYDMYGAHCVGLKLTKMPYLKGGIEVSIIYLLLWLQTTLTYRIPCAVGG